MDTKQLTEEEETRRGEMIAETLHLKKKRGETFTDRYSTTWGDKTALGLFRMMARIVLDGE